MARPPSRRILSTLFTTDPPMEEWLARVDMLRFRRSTSATICDLVSRARRYSAVVLDGSSRRDQLAAALISSRRHPPALVIADSTWKSNTNRFDVSINRLGLRAVDGRHTTFIVLSNYEVESFPRTWGPLKGRVRFIPWPYTLSPSELERSASDSGRVFAGGNSLRDYDPLIAAACSIPAPVDIATDTLSAEQLGRVPANVRAGLVPQREYDELMLAAALLVVSPQPREDRSAGQTTYVNAMARGKALVITDTPGVRDYVTDGETGLIVPPGDAGALAAAVRQLLDNPAQRQRMGDAARSYALAHLSLGDYARRLLSVVDEALAR